MHFKTFWTKINFFDCYLNEIYFKNTDFISETQRKGKTRGGRRRKKKVGIRENKKGGRERGNERERGRERETICCFIAQLSRGDSYG